MIILPAVLQRTTLSLGESIYEDFVKACEAEGAFIARNGSPEKEALVKTIWPEWPENKKLSRQTAARSIKTITELAGITVPEGTKFILLEEKDGVGKGFVTTTEKLCPVVSIIPAKDFEEGLDKMEKILDYQGCGHSCGTTQQILLRLTRWHSYESCKNPCKSAAGHLVTPEHTSMD